MHPRTPRYDPSIHVTAADRADHCQRSFEEMMENATCPPSEVLAEMRQAEADRNTEFARDMGVDPQVVHDAWAAFGKIHRLHFSKWYAFMASFIRERAVAKETQQHDPERWDGLS